MRAYLALVVVASCGGQHAEHVAAPEPIPAPPPPASVIAAASATTEPTTEPTADAPPPANVNGGAMVERDAWISSFETALPVALCRDGMYFRACFTVTPAECEITAASATRVCTRKVRKELPLHIHQPDEGTAWGSKIGSCAGTTYEVALSTKRISNAKCNDPRAWTGQP